MMFLLVLDENALNGLSAMKSVMARPE